MGTICPRRLEITFSVSFFGRITFHLVVFSQSRCKCVPEYSATLRKQSHHRHPLDLGPIPRPSAVPLEDHRMGDIVRCVSSGSAGLPNLSDPQGGLVRHHVMKTILAIYMMGIKATQAQTPLLGLVFVCLEKDRVLGDIGRRRFWSCSGLLLT